MMKLLRRTIILIACAAILSVTALTSSADSGVIRGDANGSGSVEITDATAIQRVLVNYSVQSFNAKAADIDGDGLNIMDATKIQRFLARYDDPYHIGEVIEDVTQPTENSTEPTQDNTQPTQDKYELPVV